MEKNANLPVYLTPLDGRADAAIEATWHQMTEGKKSEPIDLPMKGRSIHVPLAAGRVARFSFSDLCEKPLGASDYLAIAARFDAVFVEHIPQLGPEKRNEVKRFINLVDALYDQTVRLFVSAATAPDELLSERKGTEGFEFDRTISRLFEMRSAEYLALHNEKRQSV
jgi:cell division protein ZapE